VPSKTIKNVIGYASTGEHCRREEDKSLFLIEYVMPNDERISKDQNPSYDANATPVVE